MTSMPPGLREMVYGTVDLTDKEAADLTSGATLVCMPLDMDLAEIEGYWTKRGLPPNERGRCGRCKCEITLRPWASIATRKICLHCYEGERATAGWRSHA